MATLREEWNDATAIAVEAWDSAEPIKGNAPAEKMPWSEVAGKIKWSNYPANALEILKGLIAMRPTGPTQPPSQMAQGLGTLAQGAYDNFRGNQTPQAQAASQAWQGLPYTSEANLQQYIIEKPLMAQMDATAGLGLLGKIPGLASVGRAAAFTDPVNIAKQATAGMVRGMIPESMPIDLYRSALKAPTHQYAEQRPALQAGLDAGIYPTPGGLADVENTIDLLSSKVNGILATSQLRGNPIARTDIAKTLDSVYATLDTIPGSNKKIVDKIKADLLDPSRGPAMSIDEVQAMKKNIYKTLKDSAYGSMKTEKVEALKAVARGAKEAIATIFPEVASINAQESLFLKLEPIIERAAGRISNRDVMGIGTPIAGGAGALVTGSPLAGMTFMVAKAVLDNPSAKTLLAIYLNKAKKGGLGPGAIDARIGAYLASKMTNASDAMTSGNQPAQPGDAAYEMLP
jgi:hypothetical protein